VGSGFASAAAASSDGLSASAPPFRLEEVVAVVAPAGQSSRLQRSMPPLPEASEASQMGRGAAEAALGGISPSPPADGPAAAAGRVWGSNSSPSPPAPGDGGVTSAASLLEGHGGSASNPHRSLEMLGETSDSALAQSRAGSRHGTGADEDDIWSSALGGLSLDLHSATASAGMQH
jgi:hypothetical protein